MLIRALEFCGITFGITLVVAFLVAGIIKFIGFFLRRGEKTAQSNPAK